MKKKYYYIIGAVVLVAGGVLVYFLLRPNLKDQIIIPYIAHQKPAIDPHLPSSNQLSDKLDEVEFDGLFDMHFCIKGQASLLSMRPHRG